MLTKLDSTQQVLEGLLRRGGVHYSAPPRGERGPEAPRSGPWLPASAAPSATRAPRWVPGGTFRLMRAVPPVGILWRERNRAASTPAFSTEFSTL